MGGLRKNRDCIGLTLAWASLVQALILAFTSGLHAATLAAGADGVVLCTVRAPAGERQVPAKTPHQADWQCCATACRPACAAASAGLLPDAERVPLPASAFARVELPRVEAPALPSYDTFSSRPRAPPLA
jgi:hypothetical protein